MYVPASRLSESVEAQEGPAASPASCHVRTIRGMVGSITVEALCRDKEARHAAWRAVTNTMEVIRRGFYTCLLPLIIPIIYVVLYMVMEDVPPYFI
jgi:hypothetical protein